RTPAAAPAATPGGAMVAEDASLVEALRLAQAAARMGVPILICGETGSGKEMLARRIHAGSGRPGAYVPVNCGALPPELFEAELFGYVGGSFTGARREGSAGLIAAADGGTLLLDEVGELPLPLQAALLRFLDDALVRPVGGTAARRVDVQLLAATHVDLDAEVAARSFRSDLLYRLDTVRVSLPPLRLRSDFALAVRHLLDGLHPGMRIDDAAVARLAAHDWPGNFRELRSVLTRALLRAQGPMLGPADFEALLPAAASRPASGLQQAAAEAIRREYERGGRSVSEAARRLGVSRTTVYRHLGGRR
ncbi:MAG: sigma 54-interacting transcriptional regulator, partial [Burkholderiales bacterium]|nr:sigma 54-interacting transcriptional regulator [Burkholderiales bacterium]